MCLCYVGTYISSKLHMWQCVEMLNLCQVAKIKDQNHENNHKHFKK